jgi:hypothetical protein
MPWLRLANYPGDYVLPCPPQHLQDIRMRRTRIVIEELDPPIALAAYLSRGLQNDPVEHLPSFHRLDRADQAMATMRIAQPALAPLLLGGEQALHCPEFREWMGSKRI